MQAFLLSDARDLLIPVLAYLKNEKSPFWATELELNVTYFQRATGTEHEFSSDGLSKVVKSAYPS
jgi:hypothetical protein